MTALVIVVVLTAIYIIGYLTGAYAERKRLQ